MDRAINCNLELHFRKRKFSNILLQSTLKEGWNVISSILDAEVLPNSSNLQARWVPLIFLCFMQIVPLQFSKGGSN